MTAARPLLWQRLLECGAVTRNLQNSFDSQRGEGKLKAVVYLAILIVAVFVAIKIVPVYVAEYQLKDKITEQARFAVVNRYTDEQIKDSIYRTIQDLDIPAKREDVKVAATNHGLTISVNYSVPVDFLVYQTEINFSPSSEGIDLMK
jgi:cell division protein FtsL